MSRLVFRNLVGQQRIARVLSSGVEGGRLGHAYLLCGSEGVGTFQAALELAMGLLCLAPRDVPCYECDSCRKVLHHAHPDFSLVFPLVLGKEYNKNGTLTQKGWEHIDEVARARIAQPYQAPDADGVRTIPVEWIREVNHAVQRGALGGGANVAVMCGVELMRKESANAMLKTLEEPPAGTTLLLCTEAPHAVLPTIQSRCQILRFGSLPDTDVRDALAERLDTPLDDRAMSFVLESAQGDLGVALQLAEDPRPEAMAQARRLWGLADEADRLTVAEGLDALAGELDAGSCEKVLVYCMNIIRNSMVVRAGQGASFVPDGTPLQAEHPDAFDPFKAELLLAECRQAVRAVRARANIALVLINLVFRATELLHVKEQ